MPTLEKFKPQDLRIKKEDAGFAHIFEDEDCNALWAAWAAGRPLLVRGKPGTGKSQMAKAIAQQLGWAFVEEVIRGGTELSDLHWHFDAIGRLGEAQVQGMQPAQPSKDEGKEDACKINETQQRLSPLKFVSPGAFWWAYDWETAEQQYEHCYSRLRSKPAKPTNNPDWTAEEGGVVLLLDEMDKAEPDLPNGLLETLGNYQFSVPFLDQKGVLTEINNPIQAERQNLLVIITTNEERELPQAFVRRCFVHTLKMGSDPRWLIDRGKLHFGAAVADEVYQTAAELLLRDRQDDPHGLYPPGLAEYIDLLEALAKIEDHDEQRRRLDAIAEYALKKELQPDEDD